MTLILNVEGDELLYRAAFAVEKQGYKLITRQGKLYNFGNRYTKTQIIQYLKEKNIVHYSLEGYKLTEPLSHALFLIKRQLRALNKLGEVRLWLSPSDGSNFRNTIAVTPGPKGIGYKANRPPRPVHYNDVRKYLIERCGAKEIQGYEADDALGMYQNENTVAVHIDKDIAMIEGKHYHWVKQERYIVEAGLGKVPTKETRGTGKAFFFHQMLTGDLVDNIPGITAIGPIKATKLLEKASTEKEMLEIVAKLYYNEYKEEYKTKLIEIANLLYIVDKSGRKGEDYIAGLIC